MIDQIPPEIQATITTAVNWLWAQYGKTAVDRTEVNCSLANIAWR